jgi:hypothetical protein
MIHRNLSILLAIYVSRNPEVSFKRSHESNGCAALCFAPKGTFSRLVDLWPRMRQADYTVMANKAEALRPLLAMLVEPYGTRAPFKCPQ